MSVESSLVGNQELANSAELASGHASHEPWWDAQTPNRLTAAFHTGRLLNQLTWHLQRVFFGSSADETGADEVLSALEGISYKLVDKLPNLLEGFIKDCRRTYKSQIRSEAASEGVVAYLVDRQRNDEYISDDDHYRKLAETWVDPLLHPLREWIGGELSDSEKCALELGVCLDEGVRHSGLYYI